MNKLGQWLQVGANIGILAGLILVGLQMQQNTEVSRAALFSSMQDSWIAVDTTYQGEEFAATMAKAIHQPEQLTDAEMLEVQGFLMANLDQFQRTISLFEMGYYRRQPIESITPQVPLVFGNRFALAWWQENKDDWSPELQNVLNEALADHTSLQDHDRKKLARIRARLDGGATNN